MNNKIEISTIRKLKQQNKPDELIMKDLGLSPRTYKKYKERLHEHECQQVENIILEDIAHELLEYMDTLHTTIKECKDLSKSGSHFERTEALRMILHCHQELMRIMGNGPTILANIQVAPQIKEAFKSIAEKGEKILEVEVIKEEDNQCPAPVSDGTESNQKK